VDTVSLPALKRTKQEARGGTELPVVDSPTTHEKVTPDASQLSVHLPVDARGVALGILATLALVFALRWTQSFAISLLVGIFVQRVRLGMLQRPRCDSRSARFSRDLRLGR
jgi:hypothetical protein